MKKYLKLFFSLYAAGVVLGVLCCNFYIREKGYQTSLLPVYLASFSNLTEGRKYLFGNLLIKRGTFFFIGAICGLTPFGLPMAVASLLWFGFLGGNLITLFLVEYGLKGIGMAGLCFFPQILFCVPGWLFFFFLVAQMSQKSWGNRKKEASDFKAYFFFLTGTLICLLLGIWMESYVNQNLLCHVLEKWL